MKHSSWKVLTFFAALHAAACTVEDDWSASGVPDKSLPIGTDGCTVNLIGDGCDENGRHLLGQIFDEPGYFSVSTTAVDGDLQEVTLSLTGIASLSASGYDTFDDHDARFVGMVMTGADGTGSLRIGQVDHENSLTLFTLEYTAPGSTEPVNPCKHDRAIPLAGSFDSIARHQKTDALSFACEDEGAAYKCVNWNYPPGTNPNSPGWKAHQLCTRFVRDDFCKDGTPHTLDRTYVRAWDTYPTFGFAQPPQRFQGVNVWPPPVGVFKFEAAWPEDDNEPAICLSKTRWQGLKEGALDSCSLELGDPREDVEVAFCEDLPFPRDPAGGDNDRYPHQDLGDASLFNESKYTDLRLEQWRSGNGNGDDVVSTVDGYYPGPWSGGGPRPVPIRRPFPPNSSYRYEKSQGTILRSLPGSISDAEVRHVWSYTFSDMSGAVIDRVMGPENSAELATAGYTMDKWEGMVFVDPPLGGIPSVVELKTYRNRMTDDHINSTTPLLSLTHEFIESVGHVIVSVE